METRKSQKALVIVTGGPGTGCSYKDQRSDSRTDNDFLRRD